MDPQVNLRDDLSQRDLLRERVTRHDRQWQLFFWATVIFLAAIGGIMALTYRGEFSKFPPLHKWALVFALAGLALYACLRLVQQRIEKRVSRARDELSLLATISDNPRLLDAGILERWYGYFGITVLLVLATVFIIFIPRQEGQPPPEVQNGSWYFAVSGDSRDCGDLIMPKIANSIAARSQQLPLRFYWHLGDFRALYRIDCDWALPRDPTFKCVQGIRSGSETPTLQQQYKEDAWPDFIKHQVMPFQIARIPIYLGIGNHELIGKTRPDVVATFGKWLRQSPIDAQLEADQKSNIVPKSETYFHFVTGGVDFITLDNANIYENSDPGFSAEQLEWLDKILKADETNRFVKTVIVGMHAALPESVSKSHAMDKTCASFCSGKLVYAMLERVQSNGKQVLVLASHSHYVEPRAYNTPEHAGHVLPGWIVGTAGAEQYRADIRYGYLLIEVKPDGTVGTSFEEVTSSSLPLATGPGAEKLTDYCFAQNKRLPDPENPEKYMTAQDCPCNAK